MNQNIYSIYIPKDGFKGPFSYGKDFEELNSEKNNSFKSIYGQITELKELTDEELSNSNAIGLYKGELNVDCYQIRIALHFSDDFITYDASKHDKVFFQDYLGEDTEDSRTIKRIILDRIPSGLNNLATDNLTNKLQSKLDELKRDIAVLKDSLRIQENAPAVSFVPIIHIFENNQDSFYDDALFYDKYPKAPRFRSIIDSGIWNYYAVNNVSFNLILREIWNNWNAKYYELQITQEYADLNARLARQSYLYGDGGHGSDVSPYLFHSESKLRIERERDEVKDKSENNGVYDIKNYQWRVLLLDDRIDNNYLTPENLKIRKEDIIITRIESMLGANTCECVYLSPDVQIESVFDHCSNKKVVILCVDTVEKAQGALRYYKFDFILLDYLLKKKNDTIRRYGYELLEDLDKTIGKANSNLSEYSQYSQGERYVVGPDHRYYFMFISAFTTAISERLRLSGWSRSEELWHIAEGACPTNTPQLFCYNLRKMMVKRIKDSGIENLTPNNILIIVSDIYRPAKNGEDSVRKRANESYQKILSLLYHYNRILSDVEIPDAGKSIFSTKGSVLMTSYFQKYINIGGLLEHLVHLVHLTAFGTVRQWPEMWEENLFFKVQFADLFNGKDLENNIEVVVGGEKETKPVKEVLGALYGNIEDYILELKKLN